MSDSYYGRGIVKPHVWKPLIPCYFWIGGVAGSAAVHAAVARRRGAGGLANVQKRTALAGALVAPVLLIADLGVPARFHHMLRVVKITSPMSIGSWVLVSFGSAIGASTAAECLGRERSARAFETIAAAIGPVLATYTAVLVADTATPVWHEAAPVLPFVFAASAIAGAGAIGSAFAPRDETGSARRMMLGGALAMGIAAKAMERRLGTLLSEPYRRGRAGAYRSWSKRLCAAGAIAGLCGRRNRTLTRLAALCVVTAGVLERFAVVEAGKASAADPKYVVEPQRARLAAKNGARAE